MEKNQLYIIYYEFNKLEELDFYFSPINNEYIKIYNNRNFIYLEKNKNYTLDFTSIKINNKMIKI